MKKVNFDYSLKNIPTPGNNEYLRILIDKTESFFQRLRWRVYHFEKGHDDEIEIEKNYYGFKTSKTAPQSNNLVNFESDVIKLISNLEFKVNNSNFQKN